MQATLIASPIPNTQLSLTDSLLLVHICPGENVDCPGAVIEQFWKTYERGVLQACADNGAEQFQVKIGNHTMRPDNVRSYIAAKASYQASFAHQN